MTWGVAQALVHEFYVVGFGGAMIQESCNMTCFLGELWGRIYTGAGLCQVGVCVEFILYHAMACGYRTWGGAQLLREDG